MVNDFVSTWRSVRRIEDYKLQIRAISGAKHQPHCPGLACTFCVAYWLTRTLSAGSKLCQATRHRALLVIRDSVGSAPGRSGNSLSPHFLNLNSAASSRLLS